MKLTLIWWNTSLAPLSKTPATESQKNIICRVLEWFTEQLEADFIALGEINNDYFNYLEQNTHINGFRWLNLSNKNQRILFDTCVLIRENKLETLSSENLIVSKATNSVKIGQKLIVNVVEDKPLTIFLSHWTNVKDCNDTDRQHLATRLKDEVNTVLYADNSAPVILLGDYNAEPFSNALTTGLESTRDINRVRNKPLLLYNPFWRHLGESKIYKQGIDTTIKNRCGSYYYKKGSITRWHTFDQMLFSSCFINDSKWHLNEELTGIIDEPELLNLVMDAKQKFDHLPIISVLERD